MDEIPYPFEEGPTEYTYSFESVSEQRVIRKRVVFSSFADPRLYNLALLDELPDGTLSDSTVTNNDDLITVLATIFRIIAEFTNRLPESFVYFSGNDARRTRLYRMAISHELNRLEQHFIVLGVRGETILPFVLNEVYDGFLIKRR